MSLADLQEHIIRFEMFMIEKNAGGLVRSRAGSFWPL